MKKYAFSFISVVAVSGIISIIELALLSIWFRVPTVPVTRPVTTVLISGAIFVAILLVAMCKFARLYDENLNPYQNDLDALGKKIHKLGEVPLNSLATFVVVQVLYLIALFNIPNLLTFRDEVAMPLFCMTLALGMLNAAIVFVVTDAMTTKALLSQKLDKYPPSMRVRRQERKLFIIPMFMTLMALLFSFALTFLLCKHTGGDLNNMDGMTLFGASAVSLAYLALVVFLVRKWNTSTAIIYQSIISQLDMLTSGDRDLTGRVFITSVDELGTMAGLINHFCSSLESNMIELKAIQGELSSTGESLRQNAEISESSVEEIGSGIDTLRDKTAAQSESVGESTVAVRQIAKNIDNLDQVIVEQASSIVEASSSVEEMVGTISSINASIERMAKQFGQLAHDAKAGNALQDSAGGQIQKIVERSNSLQEANKVVAAIAAQTNLLAMNAAIEAAHAGEAGRGFSVVADEIRRLADTSSRESRKIKNEIGEVQSAIQDVVSATKESAQSFIQIAERISETDALVKELHMAISEQHEGAAQILEALRMMNEITSQVRTGSKEMSSGSSIITAEMKKLIEAAQEVTANMNRISGSITRVSEGAKGVSEIVGSTRDAISKMESVVTCFKTREV